MINKLIVKAIKDIIENKLVEVIEDIRKENESILDRYKRDYIVSWERDLDRKKSAENVAYQTLMAEIKSETFIDNIVARIKNKQL